MREEIYRLPKEFLDRLARIYPAYHTQILATFLKNREVAFRINYKKIDLQELRRSLIKQHVINKELPYPKGTFLLTKTTLREFQKTDIYLKGQVFVQNVSSMLPVTILDPQNDDKVLDLCAAPGAKTSQIVSLAPQAQVTAIEKDRIRYYKLLANLKVQGADAVDVHLLDGIWVRKKFPEYFDKILVDAPCSAEGRFLVSDPHSFKYWKERKVREMVHTQKKVLYAAFFALKEGGSLVYSTCTFSPEENEMVLDWFIDKFKGKMEIIPMDLPIKNVHDGLTHWQGSRLDSSLRLAKRVIPNDYMEGFFLAKLRKISV